MIQDALEATLSILKADAGMMEHVDKDGQYDVIRIYGGRLPKKESDRQPRKAVLLRRSSTPPFGGTAEVQRMGFDVMCFGYSEKEAADLHNELESVLKHAPRQVVDDFTLIHSYSQETSASEDVSGEGWPFVLSSWNCLASENRVST